MGSHVIVRIDNHNTDLVKQAKLLGRWESDNFKLTFGGQYIDDKFHQDGANTFATACSPALPVMARHPAEPVVCGRCPRTHSTARSAHRGFIPGYGNNALAPGFVVYDPYAIYSCARSCRAQHRTRL